MAPTIILQQEIPIPSGSPAELAQARTEDGAKPAPKGRLMLCNIGRIGDTILTNSILDSAFRTYEKVDYLCGKANESIIHCDSRLNQVTVLTNSLAGFLNVGRAALRTRYDAFIGLKDCYSTTNLMLGQMFRSKIKTGWNSDKFRPFHRDLRSIPRVHRHQVQSMSLIGAFAGLQVGEYKPSLFLDPHSVAWFRANYAWNQAFVLINVSATHSNRMWPEEKWAQYIQGCGLGNESLLINGVPGHQPIVQKLCQKFPNAIALRPRHFNDVAAAVDAARLVLSVDTGVVHACSALNKPVVALYCGGRYSVLYGPLSTRCLIIEAQPGCTVPDIDPRKAIEQTLRFGLS